MQSIALRAGDPYFICMLRPSYKTRISTYMQVVLCPPTFRFKRHGKQGQTLEVSAKVISVVFAMATKIIYSTDAEVTALLAPLWNTRVAVHPSVLGPYGQTMRALLADVRASRRTTEALLDALAQMTKLGGYCDFFFFCLTLRTHGAYPKNYVRMPSPML